MYLKQDIQSYIHVFATAGNNPSNELIHAILFNINNHALLEINFLRDCNYLLPGIKGSSKTNIHSSKHLWPSYWLLSD